MNEKPAFLLRAEVVQEETPTGHQTQLALSSPRRTVQFCTHYDFPDGSATVLQIEILKTKAHVVAIKNIHIPDEYFDRQPI